MQWRPLKILGIILPILLTQSPVLSQKQNFRLQQADSLFNAKQYTQSFELYEAILNDNQYSEAMLLKMAFVQEGLNQTGKALYYLNLYYLASQDKSALTKMEELSTKYNLQGYKQTDADRALSFYQNFHLPVSLTLAAIIFFLLSISIYLVKRKKRPLAPAIIMLFFLVVFGIHINAGEQISMGIIAQPNTYVMKGPSAGSSVISVLTAGHRLEILGKQDVWLKVEWKGETAYIKENNLLPIAL